MSSHVVNDVQESLRVVRKLESEPALAVSAEGVNMGRTGPLTLLLIGTEAGHVYIFDVKEAPDMVSDGGLKRLLESESVVKVMHSGKNHGGALYSQYEVKLSGVFDTQVAQMVLDKAGGRRFPSRLKFVDVVNMHCPERAADLGHDTHTKIKFIISKKKGEYWAQRPLTQEMVQFAENGVSVVILDVYKRQKSLLEQARLMESFRSNVERDILSQRDRTTSDELHAENKEEAKSVLVDFASSRGPGVSFADITNEDVLVALNSLRLQDVQDLPPVVQDLKVQQTKAKLDELENDLNTQGEDYVPHISAHWLLQIWIRKHPKSVKSMEQQAKNIQKRMDHLLLRDIQQKYTSTTPTAHLLSFEKDFLLNRLHPNSERDRSIPPVCLALHWRLRMEDLDRNVQQYDRDPENYKLGGYYKKLQFYKNGPVPRDLKERAREFLDRLHRAGHF